MPPNHKRSTGALRMARISAAGSSAAAVMPSRARICGDSGIDFWLRGNTPPPGDNFAVS